MNKHDTDQRYAGVVFTGTMDEAISQAKAAPDHRQTMDSVAHRPWDGTASHARVLNASNVIQFPVRK